MGLPTEAERRGHRVSTLVICAKHYNNITLRDVRFWTLGVYSLERCTGCLRLSFPPALAAPAAQLPW